MKDLYNRSPSVPKFSREFLSRRIHSFSGFVFLLFLIEHLLTNSQAALFIGDDGKGFIDSVNFIHSLPYLPVIELSFIALPAFLHTWWGIERLFSSKDNSRVSDGRTPSLPLSRNHAYTWQRITAGLLIFAIALHVWYMRFHEAPVERKNGYSVLISDDPGLDAVAKRLNILLVKEDKKIVATAPTPGAAMLMTVRDTYKSITLCVLYSIFVVMAAFHACNGLWMLCITWGITLPERSRQLLRLLCNGLMALLIFFGLSCIWGVYWINLRY